MGRRSLLNSSQSFRDAYRKVLRSRWITHVCTMVSGHVVVTASGRPFRPSHTTMQTSWTPRFLISVSTDSQNFAPSPPSPAHSPRMSRSPLQVTPIATYTGRLVTCPSRTFDHDRVDEHHGINPVQWAISPIGHLLK